MIRQDRIQLNDRFIKVFKLLEKRGDIIKNDRNGKGVGDLAEKILENKSYGHIVRAFLNKNDKRVIDYHQAKKLCEEYNVNESYLIDGKGEPFGLSVPIHDELNDVSASYNGNILFTNKHAFAGTTVDVGTAEDLEYFSIPGIGGAGLVAFPIDGNSMEPVIQDGDIVICREIGSINDVRDNEIYAVKADGRLWVKYVQKIKDTYQKVAQLKLISANYLEHDPFEEEVNEYTRLYKVISRINKIQTG